MSTPEKELLSQLQQVRKLRKEAKAHWYHSLWDVKYQFGQLDAFDAVIKQLKKRIKEIA